MEALEVGLAVQVLAFGAEGADDLGFYLFEGGGAGFLDWQRRLRPEDG